MLNNRRGALTIGRLIRVAQHLGFAAHRSRIFILMQRGRIRQPDILRTRTIGLYSLDEFIGAVQDLAMTTRNKRVVGRKEILSALENVSLIHDQD